MSFSGDIKEEISGKTGGKYHCQVAEIMAILSMCGGICVSPQNRISLKMQTEYLFVARKYFTLLRKSFNIKVELSIRQHKGKRSTRQYCVCVNRHEDAVRILRASGMLRENGTTYMDLADEEDLRNSSVLERTCCKRAFIRGAFLVTGSVSDPVKDYHMEFACSSESCAGQIRSVLQDFQLEARIVQRKKYYVVYLKEGDGIVDALNIMEAHNALMKLENVRILKDMRNTLNRKVNCETANITKTVNAAYKQIEDIRYIRDTIGFEGLSEGLADAAQVRLDNPDVSLKELGLLLTPPVGKSGMNHRLRRLSELADQLRNH